MKYGNLYPKITSQIFPSNTSKEEIFIFNTQTNRGFSLDGFAAALCKRFNGEKKLAELIVEMETEQSLSPGLFATEIESLMQEMESNKLVTFSSEPIIA